MISDTKASRQKMTADDRLPSKAAAGKALAAEQSPQAVGRRIKLMRTYLKLRQADAAERTSIRQPSWSEYESGKTLLPAEVALALCNDDDVARRCALTMDWIYRNRDDDLNHRFAEWLKTHS